MWRADYVLLTVDWVMPLHDSLRCPCILTLHYLGQRIRHRWWCGCGWDSSLFTWFRVVVDKFFPVLVLAEQTTYVASGNERLVSLHVSLFHWGGLGAVGWLGKWLLHERVHQLLRVVNRLAAIPFGHGLHCIFEGVTGCCSVGFLV